MHLTRLVHSHLTILELKWDLEQLTVTHSHYTPIAFDERVTFLLQLARSMPCACAFAAFYVCAIA